MESRGKITKGQGEMQRVGGLFPGSKPWCICLSCEEVFLDFLVNKSNTLRPLQKEEKDNSKNGTPSADESTADRMSGVAESAPFRPLERGAIPQERSTSPHTGVRTSPSLLLELESLVYPHGKWVLVFRPLRLCL